MQKIVPLIALSIICLISTANASEFNMRPGLWQITTSSDLLRLAPAIPPDQMQAARDLAKQYGVEMPEIENGAAITKACITPEMAKQKALPNFYQDQTGCASKNTSRKGNDYKVDFTCDGADLKGSGAAEGRLTSAESFIGGSKFTGTAQGKPVNEKADINGKWLGAKCGEVKPM
ncbi:MAG: DUF3617 domain-containing protein [Methylophilaceae bacterium]